MGGCRCTYKNCSLKSDGVTHMFHYPVFDKVRCHQWLTNAQKLEFLNLKVSQLKNRVVCQHHFKDDNFMNFLKDKLTFDAVPTLDGSFCDSSQLADKKPVQDVSKLYSISLEDIENEYLSLNDKKANFSVKYGDFLTNCELMDLDSMNLANDNTQVITKNEGVEGHNNTILNNNIEKPKDATNNPFLNKMLDTLHTNNNNVLRVEVTEVPLEINQVPLEINEVQVNVPLPNVNEPQFQPQQTNITVLTHKPKEQSKKITILDEKKIEVEPVPVPLPFPVKLEPICPSAILTLPRKRRNLNMNSQPQDKPNSINKLSAPDLVESSNIVGQVVTPGNNIIKIVNIPDEVNVSDKVDNSNFKNEENTHTSSSSRMVKRSINKEKHAMTSKVSLQKSPSKAVNIVTGKKSNHSLLKNRIPPERVAAIEEKRKFNMKLRDIIASCLDKLDAEETNDYENNKIKEKLKNNITQNVSSYLSKEPELPALQDYTVAYLEARMKKMEEILLKKIDQNSQRIMDIKTLLVPSVSKKAAYTQTAANDEVQKKNLYNEISKFLSPQANSLLYEELFINKYAHKIQVRSPAKKRKYR